MAWFKRQSGELDISGEKTVRTEGLWVKCDGCRQIIWKKDLEQNLQVCPKCDKHFRIDARSRLAQLLDDGEFETFDGNLASTDPLHFTDLKAYSTRLTTAQADTGLKDAVINARGKLNGRPVIISSMEYAFIGGSMGAVVGEAITRSIERATETRTPLIIVMEDLHWADTSSLQLLESLFRLAETHGILFINLFRPGFLETGERILKTLEERLPVYHLEMVLKPLDECYVRTLIGNMLTTC